MPLLLFLSAILTALTGAVAGVRPVDVQIARQAAPSDVRRIVAVAASVISGHVHLLGAFGVTATFASALAVSRPSTSASRLYRDRPRV